MITATWTWTDIRNFEEDACGYQRAQWAWALVVAAALVLVITLFGLAMIADLPSMVMLMAGVILMLPRMSKLLR